MDDSRIPVRLLRLNQSGGESSLVEPVSKPLFIRGPIPVAWLGAAAKLPGKALHLAAAIQWLAGMNANRSFKLTRKALELLSVSDDAAQDGLKRLEAAGLIAVTRKPGTRPLITMCQVS